MIHTYFSFLKKITTIIFHSPRLVALFLLLMISGQIGVYAQSFTYAHTYGAGHFDEALAIAADNNNNLYMTATFIGQWAWREGDTLQSSGGTDFAIVRLDAQGQPVWVRSGGGRVDDELSQLAVLPDGSALAAAGWMRDTLVLGNDTLTTEGLSGDNGLLVKYDSNGNLQWARQWAGKGISRITALINGDNGQIYAGGIFTDTLLINDTDTLVASGGFDMLVARYDANGDLLGYKQLGGSQTEVLNTIALSPNGFLYVGGYFVGNTGLGAFNLQSAGESDALLLKTDNEGNVWWAKQFGGQYAESIERMEVDGNGNLLLGGVFTDQTTWGDISLTGWGITDIVLAQTDSEGSPIWVVNVGSEQGDALNDLTLDAQNNIYLAGNIGGTTVFGDNFVLYSTGNSDAFAAKFDALGTPLWAQSAGGTLFDSGNSIWVANDGYCYWAGTYIGQANFEGFVLSGNGMADMFVAQIDQSIIDVAISPDLPNANNYPQLTAYPNPATEFVWVKIPASFLAGNTQITLSMPNGQVVYQTDLYACNSNTDGNFLHQILLHDLPKGVYILTLQNEKMLSSAKIVYM